VHYPITPIHKPCKISIFPERLPSRLKNKALIVRVSEQGKPIAAGGKWEHDRLTINIQRFGTYSVLADTVSPLIRPLNLLANKPHRGNQPLKIKISDDLSGIASYEATLNGSWILMEYDAKNNLLIYNPDEWIQEGNNELIIKVTDGVGNTSSRMISFKYKP